MVVMANGMVQRRDESGKPLVDFCLFERELTEVIIPFAEKRFHAGRSRERRAMAGLSMGSMQTSRCGFMHPELFSALGIFSGFVRDVLTGSALDMVSRPAGRNEHLAFLDDPERFAKSFPVYFRAMGDEDPFLTYFLKDDEMLNEKRIPQTRRIYHGGHDWNVWRACIRDFAQIFQNPWDAV